MTEASLRNSMRSRMVASSLTVFRATLVSSPSATSPTASPSYTIPKEPCPSSRITVIFSRDTSHSSGMYTAGGSPSLMSPSPSREMGQQTPGGHPHILSEALKYSGLTEAYSVPLGYPSLLLGRWRGGHGTEDKGQRTGGQETGMWSHLPTSGSTECSPRVQRDHYLFLL